MIRHLLHALVLFFADRFSSCLVFILQPAPSRSRRTNTERGDQITRGVSYDCECRCRSFRRSIDADRSSHVHDKH